MGHIAIWTMLGLAFAGQRYLTSAKVGEPVAWGSAIAGALADWYLFGLLALPASWLARRWSLSGRQWRLRVALHLAGSAVYSLLWILLRTALAQAIVPLRGVEKPFGEMLGLVLVATFFFNVIVYWVVVTGTHALAYYESFRERERRVLELENRLTSARLHALRMQLNPHFLFNALNGIGTLMYRDVDAADAMLVKLAGLLRQSLEGGERSTGTLRDEIGFLDRYLALEQMRFGERLVVLREIDPALLDLEVPTLLLQPLVENAIKHGVEPMTRPGTIVLRAARIDEDRVRLEVEDDGLGLRGTPRSGVGTSNTFHRLQQHYGPMATFTLAPREGGGTRATIELPG